MNTMTDHELETVKQHCYAEGRKDVAEPMQQVLALLRPVYAEVAGKERPYSTDSYLPPQFVEQLAKAIRIAEGGAA